MNLIFLSIQLYFIIVTALLASRGLIIERIWKGRKIA